MFVMGFLRIECMVHQSFPSTLSVHQDHHARHRWQAYHGHVLGQKSCHSCPSRHSHWPHPWGNPTNHRSHRKHLRSSTRQAPSHQVTALYPTWWTNSPKAAPTTSHTAEWLYHWQGTNPYVGSNYLRSAHCACQCHPIPPVHTCSPAITDGNDDVPPMVRHPWTRAQLSTCVESHLINMVRKNCPITVILLICKLIDNHQTCSPPITSPKQKMVIQIHLQKKLWFKDITNNKIASIYHMNRFLPLLAHH